MLLFTLFLACLASSIGIARQAPDTRIKISSSVVSLNGLPPLMVPVSATVASTAWIKDFLLFYSKDAELLALSVPVEKKPLRTKITNYGSVLANEGDLSSFTRHLVELLREEYAEKKPKNNRAKPAVIELDIEQFISYLIEHKGFTEKQLNFLRRPELDYGYESIERELTQIRRQQTPQKHISIGGEISAGSLPSRPSLFIWSLILLLS